MKHRRLQSTLLIMALISPTVFGFDNDHSELHGSSIARFLAPKEDLGKQIFFDTNLSQPAGQACASCHAPKVAFTEPNQTLPTSQGATPGFFGNRNSPTAMYSAFSPFFHFDSTKGSYLGGQFWDGRAATLEEQAKGPFLNPIEMGNPDKESVISKIRESSYAPLFKNVYGQDSLNDTEQAYEHVAEAIASFERTRSFNRFTSKFDAWLAGKARLNHSERRGLALFNASDKGNCAACHSIQKSGEDTPPLFTDFSYDNVGVPKNPDNPFYAMPGAFNPNGHNFVDKGLGGAIKLASEDGKFKVPTLRNIAITAPYMHNGYFSSLRAVVDFYNTRDTKPACKDAFTSEQKALTDGCWPVAEVSTNVNTHALGNLGLSSREVDDIVAFLQTLTDGW
jgi:cytochrome c peroxidase